MTIQGSPEVRQQEEGALGKHRQQLSLWFPQEGMDKAQFVGVGLATVSNFSRVWGGDCPDLLERLGQGNSNLECKNPTEAYEGGGWGSRALV